MAGRTRLRDLDLDELTELLDKDLAGEADNLDDPTRLRLMELVFVRYRRRWQTASRHLKLGLGVGIAILLFGQVQTRDLASDTATNTGKIQAQREESFRVACERDKSEKFKQRRFLESRAQGQPLPRDAIEFTTPYARDCAVYAKRRLRGKR